MVILKETSLYWLEYEHSLSMGMDLLKIPYLASEEMRKQAFSFSAGSGNGSDHFPQREAVFETPIAKNNELHVV